MYLFVFSRVFVTLRTQAMSAPKNRMWWCPWWSNSSHSPSMRIIAIHKCNCRHNLISESLWPLLPKKKIYNLTPASCKCFVPLYLSILLSNHATISTCSINRDQLHKHDYEASPMSITDILSPMSVDRSMAETSNISNDQISIIDKDISATVEPEPLPRNDRQRFFEVVQYQHDILKNFRESEVSKGIRATIYWKYFYYMSSLISP